jgi:hypothetical protein
MTVEGFFPLKVVLAFQDHSLDSQTRELIKNQTGIILRKLSDIEFDECPEAFAVPYILLGGNDSEFEIYRQHQVAAVGDNSKEYAAKLLSKHHQALKLLKIEHPELFNQP